MTNAALDLAINGEGFAIQNPNNPDELKYTRNGSINLTMKVSWLRWMALNILIKGQWN